jgi:hypothetical protein
MEEVGATEAMLLAEEAAVCEEKGSPCAVFKSQDESKAQRAHIMSNCTDLFTAAPPNLKNTRQTCI